jgi:Leucine-rich repeat (LRR) protein
MASISNEKINLKPLVMVVGAALFSGVSSQTIAQDCATVINIWQKMGQKTAIPSSCCEGYGIKCSRTRVTHINWENKSLTGSIPEDIKSLTGLLWLQMNDNQITGPLPSGLGKLINLQFIYLQNNKISGSIPSNIGDLVNLQRLFLKNNQLSGSIPESIGGLRSLERLYLEKNQLSGSIPSSMGDLVNLLGLYLSSNPVSGSIPDTLGNLTKLQMLQLTETQLTGPIPSSLGNLASLQSLWLYKNQLSGPIPSTIGRLPNLKDILLHNNQLSGPIPSEMGNLANLTRLWIANNQFTGFPSNLKSANTFAFPNPMSDVPYNLVRPASIGLLSDVTLIPFLDTPALLRKRQTSSNTADMTVNELVKLCPLNSGIGSASGSDVAAGCISGIYQKYCTKPWDPTLLVQCQRAYEGAFSASIFKELGSVCPAWKSGPRSQDCTSKIAAFSYAYPTGIDPSSGTQTFIQLTSSTAKEMVNTIFASQKYAPCVASTCKWY